jgi:tetratricopeptide (TPR) repeat protein
MRRFDNCQLPALTLMAAIVCSCGFAQSPAAPSSDSVPTPTNSQVATVPVPAPAVLPKTPQTPQQLGDALMAHQRYQAAIEAYKKAPKNDPLVWNKLGIAYQLMFNPTDAMHCYQTSYKLDPKNSNVLNNLGTVYDAMKEYHNAEKMYRKALKIDPTSALVLKNLGTNLLAQHKYEKGWKEYQAAIKIDPLIFQDNSRPRIQNPASISDRGAMNFYLAKGCVRAGMPERAIEYLRMALNEGYTSPKKIVADNEFATLHGLPAFQELISSESQKRQ